jgi:alkylation response protein AidB-like acyl-CoA dehydrogenase
MDFSVLDHLESYRGSASRWVAETLPELPLWVEEQRVSGTYHTAEFHRRMASAGWLGAGWPPEYGGTDHDPDMAYAIQQEVGRLGLRSDGWVTTSGIINVLRYVGTDEQKREFIPAALRGEIIIVLGYSEPDSGSDVAAAKTRAVRDGDEWIINGEKMFTTNAHLGTHAFMLTRTNLEAPKHKGLTTFLVSLDSPGVAVQPVWTLGERTNATSFADVRTPDRYRVGDVDGGWRTMQVGLMYERIGTSRDHGGPILPERVARWAQESRREDGSRVWDDATVRERLTRIAIEDEVAKMLGFKAGWAAQHDDLSGIGQAAVKLFSTEASQRHTQDMLDIVGAAAVLKREARNAPLDAALEESLRAGILGTIAGGTSEICREIVAERQLGLPRARPHV